MIVLLGSPVAHRPPGVGQVRADPTTTTTTTNNNNNNNNSILML